MFLLSNWPVTTGSQICNLRSAGAFRMHGAWCLRLYVTSRRVDAFANARPRVKAEEFARFDTRPGAPPFVPCVPCTARLS